MNEITQLALEMQKLEELINQRKDRKNELFRKLLTLVENK